MADPDGLKELGGAASAFIGMMATAIVALAGAVGIQWKHSSKVYGYRLAERDTLRDALNGNTKAVENFTRATEERNRVTEELAEAIDKLAQAFERQNDRLVMHHESVREQGKDAVKVIGEMAEALRNNTGIVTDIRSHLSRNGII